MAKEGNSKKSRVEMIREFLGNKWDAGLVKAKARNKNTQAMWKLLKQEKAKTKKAKALLKKIEILERKRDAAWDGMHIDIVEIWACRMQIRSMLH